MQLLKGPVAFATSFPNRNLLSNKINYAVTSKLEIGEINIYYVLILLLLIFVKTTIRR